MAYADGVASPEISAQMQGSPQDLALALAYRRTQERLRQTLYRFDCPSPQLLGEYDLGLIAGEERRQVAAHVVECPHCAADLRQWRDFLAQEDAPLTLRPTDRLRRLVGALLPANPAQAGARLRGSDTSTEQSYRAADIMIVLDIAAPSPRARGALSGLVLREDEDAPAVADSPVTLTDQDGVIQTTILDDLGNFTFSDLPPGRYHVEVTLGDDLVSIPNLQIGD